MQIDTELIHFYTNLDGLTALPLPNSASEDNMQKQILREMVAQNRTTCSYAFSGMTNDNASYRLNERSASIGFIYRHIGETMNLFGLFLGVPTDVQNTTMGQQDVGQEFDLTTSHLLIERGYEMLETLIANTPDESWLDAIETPFFGTVSRIRLFSHVLFHTASHAGQIALSLAKAQP